MSLPVNGARLRVSDNKRFLQKADGAPFFYLADTAWELFHRASREEAEFYLQDRAAKGFTVIQAVVLAEEDGLHTPNANGDLPLHHDNPTRPNQAYFAHVDFIVQTAASLGLTIGMLPTWGDKWNRRHGVGPEIFTPENAAVYGEFLGRRYRDSPVIWIVGGDRPIQSETQRTIIEATVAGIKAGDAGAHLMTFHPCGQQTSSQYFHNAEWLDFNMYQTGHARDRDNYNSIAQEYSLFPTKPCLDGEPGYENIKSGLQSSGEFLNDYDVRKSAYWSLFAGACGYTYGCNEVWQCWQPGRAALHGAHLPWLEALQLPGASQVQHARKLLESKPYFSRVPDQSLILESQSEGAAHLQATRDEAGSYALIYFAASTPAVIDLQKLMTGRVRAAWFDPRTGASDEVGEFAAQPREFQPQRDTSHCDRVLVLDAVK